MNGACKLFAEQMVYRSHKSSSVKESITKSVPIIKDGFDRLAKFVGENPFDSELFFAKLGLSSKYRPLSISKDPNLYDIIDTYQLPYVLFSTNNDWNKAWNAIYQFLTRDNGDNLPAASKEVVEKLQAAFERIRKICENLQDYSIIVFENFVINCETNELVLASS